VTTRTGIEEPVPPALQRVLRRAVLEHVQRTRRRSRPPALNAGFPGGPHRRLELDPRWELDQTLRIDMVEAITRDDLAAGRVPLVWLTRPDLADGLDQAWAAAVRAAGAELGVRLDLVVVTRHSWHDPHTGVGRRWQRVRER
jgi:hypothetical protein